MRRTSLIVMTVALAWTDASRAQNLSNVDNPDVRAGDVSLEYRMALIPSEGASPAQFSHRLHAQYAINDAWRVRISTQQTDRDGSGLKYRGVQPEVQWQFLESEKSGGFDSALIFQGHIPDGNGGPGRLRVSWASKFEPVENMEVRFNLIAARDVGDHGRAGVGLEAREQIAFRLTDEFCAGIMMFNNFNTTAHFGSFDEQRHQAGPTLHGKLSKHLSYNVSLLFGLSTRAPDEEFRIFLGYGF